MKPGTRASAAGGNDVTVGGAGGCGVVSRIVGSGAAIEDKVVVLEDAHRVRRLRLPDAAPPTVVDEIGMTETTKGRWQFRADPERQPLHVDVQPTVGTPRSQQCSKVCKVDIIVVP